MISATVRAEMRRLVLGEHWRIGTVARRFGVHHSTVRNALRDQLPTDEKAPQSALDPYKQFVIERLTEYPELSAVRLFSEIKAKGYVHGIAVLRVAGDLVDLFLRLAFGDRLRDALFAIRPLFASDLGPNFPIKPLDLILAGFDGQPDKFDIRERPERREAERLI